MIENLHPATPIETAAIRTQAIELVKELRDLVDNRRAIYARDRRLVEANLANRERKNGRKKLLLSMDDLVSHENAKQSAREAQNELLFLVPVLRLVLAARDNGELFNPKNSLRLGLAALKLSYQAFSNARNATDTAKTLARNLLGCYGNLFCLPTSASKPALSKVENSRIAAKRALLEKIKASVPLTDEEAEILSKALA